MRITVRIVILKCKLNLIKVCSYCWPKEELPPKALPAAGAADWNEEPPNTDPPAPAPKPADGEVPPAAKAPKLGVFD